MLMLDRTSIFTLEFTVMFRRRAELYIITSQDHKTSVVGYRNIKEKSATAVWPQQCWVRVKRDSTFLAQQLLHKHSLGFKPYFNFFPGENFTTVHELCITNEDPRNNSGHPDSRSKSCNNVSNTSWINDKTG